MAKKDKSPNQRLLSEIERQIKFEYEALAKAKEAMWNEPPCFGSEEIGFHRGRIGLLESFYSIIKEGRFE